MLHSAHFSTLVSLDRQFRALDDQKPLLTLDGWKIGGTLPARDIRLSELADLLRGRRVDPQTKDAVWAELVRCAHSEGRGQRWTLGSIGVMLPALRRAVRRITADSRADSGDVESEVVVGFLEALKAVAPETRGLSTLLPRMAYQRALATLPRVERDQDRSFTGRSVPLTRYGHVDLVLSRAVDDGVLTPLDAEVIGRSRIEQLHLSVVATDLRLSYEDCVQRSRAAEKRLAAYLGYRSAS
ncbi:hypothetical protein [Goodfellowiella coeruleoviolacea]|uniref:Uncharacterized protein n=1 Tax=Goodfellowiella coeruleoviolacea TaxID=334858 RepID=A0AAE3GJ76_9PSEU|nr:hypothetical protein [Goodfellowiella coeruleoviolacea]MCP2167128.1 hypothetical protein [Goodfellowiella coeruleoviolacea]